MGLDRWVIDLSTKRDGEEHYIYDLEYFYVGDVTGTLYISFGTNYNQKYLVSEFDKIVNISPHAWIFLHNDEQPGEYAVIYLKEKSKRYKLMEKLKWYR